MATLGKALITALAGELSIEVAGFAIVYITDDGIVSGEVAAKNAEILNTVVKAIPEAIDRIMSGKQDNMTVE